MKYKKKLLTALPYVIIGLFMTNIGEAWRMAEGQDASKRVLSFFQTLPEAFRNPLPSFQVMDILIGGISALLLFAIMYVRRQNAKKFRPKAEYGSARWSA